MARRLRVSFPGAIYHLINRGNYRTDVFATAGAVQAFLNALDEACRRYGWRVAAYVVMRNHYHVAAETPAPNLSEGMHWLQSTFATRFNRFRHQRGHLFQARYQAILVENGPALARLCDYLHLNPVRAGVVSPAAILDYPCSSLPRFVGRNRPPWLVADGWLGDAGANDSPAGWRQYVASLVTLAADAEEQRRRGFEHMCRGAAIGTQGWRTAIARTFAAQALAPGLAHEERLGLLEVQWEEQLAAELKQMRRAEEHLNAEPSTAAWKVDLACRLRSQGLVPYRWLATRLGLGSPDSLRVTIRRRLLRVPA